MQTILKYYYKDDAIVNAIQEITSDDIVIKSLDNSKFMNVNA
jgi:hypothetical protein